MPLNRDTHSPSVSNNEGVTVAYDLVLTPTLRGIDVLVAGRLAVLDIEGRLWEHNFLALNPQTNASQAYTVFPYRLELQISKIVGNGAGLVGSGAGETDIALASLRLLH